MIQQVITPTAPGAVALAPAAIAPAGSPPLRPRSRALARTLRHARRERQQEIDRARQEALARLRDVQRFD